MIPAHEQIDGGEEYLGWARQKLAVLERTRLESGSPEMERFYYPDDGVEVYVRASDNRPLIWITGPVSGFAIHPRVADSDDADIDFPLIDDDGKTSILTVDGDNVDVDNDPPVENYGNLCWMSSEDGDVLSWKGPPGVAIELDSWQDVTGLTVEDDIVDLNYRYTALRNTVYSQGDALFTLPEWGIIAPKVLCAGYDAFGRLVVLAGTNYQNTQNPDGGIGGYYDELVTYNGTQWVRLHIRRSSRHTLPAFLSSNGASIVSQFGRYTIQKDKVIFSAFANPVAGYKEYSGSGWGVEVLAGRNTAYHLGGSLRLSFSGTDASTKIDNPTRTLDTVPVYAPVDDDFWVTLSEETAGCGCLTGGGPGYKYYPDGYRDVVYWCKTQLPADKTMTFADVVAWMEVGSITEGAWCGKSYTRPIYTGDLLDLANAGKLIIFPEGFASTISQCAVDNFYEPSTWGTRSPGWYKTNDNPAYGYTMGGPWKGISLYNYCADAPKSPHFSFSSTSYMICSDYLSDSYKSGVTDIYGDSIEVPDTIDGYIVKVCKVIHQRCSSL